jgi:hypothetical protein
MSPYPATHPRSVPPVDLARNLLFSCWLHVAGDVYEAYFARVLEKPGVEERSPDYETQIRPLLQANL